MADSLSDIVRRFERTVGAQLTVFMKASNWSRERNSVAERLTPDHQVTLRRPQLF